MNVKITGPNGSALFEAERVDYNKHTRALRMATAGLFGPDQLLEAGVNAYVTNDRGETIAKYEGWSPTGTDRAQDPILFEDGTVGQVLTEFGPPMVARGTCGSTFAIRPVSRRDDGAIEHALQIYQGEKYLAVCLDNQTMVHLAARALSMVDAGPGR